MADKEKGEEHDLQGVYGAVQTGIWMIGLAILFWQGWWWPGILILIAISGITQAVLQSMAKRQEGIVQAADAARVSAMAVPPNCPTCGATINASSVVWNGPAAAHCPYCKSAIPLKSGATSSKE